MIKKECDIYELIPVFSSLHGHEKSGSSSSAPPSNPRAISMHGHQLLSELFMKSLSDLQHLELSGVLQPVSSMKQLFKFCAVVIDFFTYARNEPTVKEVILRDVAFNENLKCDFERECRRCHIAVDSGYPGISKQEPWIILSQGNGSITIVNVYDC